MYYYHSKKSTESRWGFETIKKIATKSRRSIYFIVCTQKVTILHYSND